MYSLLVSLLIQCYQAYNGVLAAQNHLRVMSPSSGFIPKTRLNFDCGICFPLYESTVLFLKSFSNSQPTEGKRSVTSYLWSVILLIGKKLFPYGFKTDLPVGLFGLLLKKSAHTRPYVLT